MWFSGVFAQNDGALTVEGDCQIRENETYKIALMCNSSEDETEQRCKELLELGLEAVHQLNGRFTLLLYNKTTRHLHCFQDFLCGLSPVYYTQKDRKVYLSTSLREMLLSSGIQRKMDKRSFRMFTIRNAVYGSDTLIKGVKKLQLQKSLHITCDGITVQDHCIPLQTSTYKNNTTAEDCEILWGKCIKESICKCAVSETEVTMPLSSGYDSNCILWHLAQTGLKKIHCYSVGGTKGISEISAAKEIAEQYDTTHFVSAEVSPETFQALPDIVWRLEGSMYEQGVFLQYALAKAIHQDGGKIVICGEGSDEIFSDNFFRDLQNPTNTPTTIFGRKSNMYVWLAQYISRKSTLIMNSFGILPRYPFPDKSVLPIVKQIKTITKTKGKAFHKAFCQKCFSDNVMQKINSVGGKTNLASLFNTDPYKELKALKKQTGIHFGIALKAHNLYETVRMWAVNAIKGKRYDIQKVNAHRFSNQMIVHLYLKVFSEIYLSGKYDTYFKAHAFDMELKDILQDK